MVREMVARALMLSSPLHVMSDFPLFYVLYWEAGIYRTAFLVMQ